MEIWKDVIGFEDSYAISNLGRLMSKDRYIKVGGNGKRFMKSQIIIPTKCTNGYLEYILRCDGNKKVYLAHRLVAMHFIDNPNNLPEINHKDENIKNNNVENLEWCTSKYNANYGTRNKRMVKEYTKKKVKQITLEGKLIKTWDSISDASRQCKADLSQIIRVCKGKQKTCKGFVWRYVYTGGIVE